MSLCLLCAAPSEEDFPTQLLHRIWVPLPYALCRTGPLRVTPGPAPLGRSERAPCLRWLHRPFTVWPWQVTALELQEPRLLALGSGGHHGCLAVSVDLKIGVVRQGPGH